MILRINEPKTYWDSNTLRSSDYNDIYFSTHGAVAESEYVYLKQNLISERFSEAKDTWIGEVGFGLGINFTATLAQWTTHRSSHLHYLSIESSPFDREFLRNTYQKHFPALDSKWIDLYPRHPTAGIFSLPVTSDVTLHLLFGDALSTLSQWVSPREFEGFDAWYLDGFSPNKNESAWNLKLLRTISSLSHPGSTASTYSVASSVRESLVESGFEVEKIPGIGKKKQILKATLIKPCERKQNLPPWFATPPATQSKSITVLGSGLAGASAARTFAERGWQVKVIEPMNEIASGASGNPAGIFMPHLASEANDTSRFSLHAFQTFQRWFEKYGSECGATSHVREVHLTQDAIKKTKQAIQEHCLRPGLAHITQDKSILYSTSGWVNPKLWCKTLLDHPLIQVQTNASIQISGPTIVALGAESMKHLPTLGFKMKSIKGQIVSIPEKELKSSPWETLMNESYCIPTTSDLVLGATFEQKKTDSLVDWVTLEPFIKKGLKHLDLELRNETIHHEWKARASLRAMTPDKLPIVGNIPHLTYYKSSYQDLHKGKRLHSYPVAQYDSEIFVLSGLGSRGITYACNAAELIADLIEGKPLGMDADLYMRLHPARFLIRAFKSRKSIA